MLLVVVALPHSSSCIILYVEGGASHMVLL